MKKLLDTNVVSALANARVDVAVGLWSEQQLQDELAISVITISEIRLGVELRAPGRRRTELENFLSNGLPLRFKDRILPVDDQVADEFGHILARCERAGFDFGERDLLIAATAAVHDLVVVTRNVKHFEPLGLRVLNPWDWSD